jgi:hypothetical protein
VCAVAHQNAVLKFCLDNDIGNVQYVQSLTEMSTRSISWG